MAEWWRQGVVIVLTLCVTDWWWQGWWLCSHYLWLTDDDRGDDCVDIICGRLVMMGSWWLCWYFCGWVMTTWGDDCVDIMCDWLMMTGEMIVLTLFVGDWWWWGDDDCVDIWLESLYTLRVTPWAVPKKSGHVVYGAILFPRLLMLSRQKYGILCLWMQKRSERDLRCTDRCKYT